MIWPRGQDASQQQSEEGKATARVSITEESRKPSHNSEKLQHRSVMESYLLLPQPIPINFGLTRFPIRQQLLLVRCVASGRG
jgi:hypothetical protein